MSGSLAANSQIYYRFNQVGYHPADNKTAIIMSEKLLRDLNYKFISLNGGINYQGRMIRLIDPVSSFYVYQIDFSRVSEQGFYNIAIGSTISPPITIGGSFYKPILSKALDFLKVQRCGNTSPKLHKPCHLADATTIHPENEEPFMLNLTGGWHDAGDYTKFLNTTAYTAYLLLLASEISPDAFTDQDQNGIPDVVDEAKIGLDWCMKAHYAPEELIIQVQNNNDQTVGWRMPEYDPLASDRPGYNLPSKAQFGVTSAAFALGCYVFKKYGDYEYGEKCLRHAVELFGLTSRKFPETSCGPDSVYYDRSSWDNIALAAIELYRTTGNVTFLDKSKEILDGRETVHWVSWGDLSGLALARLAPYNQQSLDSLEQQLAYFDEIAKMDSYGYPLESYPWVSASIQAGVTMLAILHNNVTGSGKYLPLAFKQRDFLFGLNSHGVCFVSGVGLEYPRRIHHQISKIQEIVISGALMAGFVNKVTFEKSNIVLDGRDPYEKFQNDIYVYHDHHNDYLCNEPSISNNAQLILALAGFYQLNNED
jgi:hypothetical protein